MVYVLMNSLKKLDSISCLNGDVSIVKSDELTIAQGYDVNVSNRENRGALINCEPDLCDIVCI